MVWVSEADLQYKKGQSDKKDSLLVLRNAQIDTYKKSIASYERFIISKEEEMKVRIEQEKLACSSAILQNTSLIADNKTLRRKRGWSKVKQVVFPILAAGATYIIIK